MSVEVIRQAARLIREREETPFMLAVADWLDAEAGAVEFDGGRPDLLTPAALAVANAYLGER